MARRHLFLVLSLCFLSITPLAFAKKPRGPPPPPPPLPESGIFDHFVLSLQWPISWYNTGVLGDNASKGTLPLEFKIHGLWPTAGPEKPAPRCSQEPFDPNQITWKVMEQMKLNWIDVKNSKGAPGTWIFFWKHEWGKHGCASSLTQLQYFKSTTDLYNEFNKFYQTIKTKYAQKIGQKIDLRMFLKEFQQFGEPSLACVNDVKKQEQLWELRFNVTRDTLEFKKSTATSNCSSPLVLLPGRV